MEDDKFLIISYFLEESLNNIQETLDGIYPDYKLTNDKLKIDRFIETYTMFYKTLYNMETNRKVLDVDKEFSSLFHYLLIDEEYKDFPEIMAKFEQMNLDLEVYISNFYENDERLKIMNRMCQCILASEVSKDDSCNIICSK